MSYCRFFEGESDVYCYATTEGKYKIHTVAGHVFEEPDASAAAARLQTLKTLGYLIPGEAIKELLDEAVPPRC